MYRKPNVFNSCEFPRVLISSNEVFIENLLDSVIECSIGKMNNYRNIVGGYRTLEMGEELSIGFGGMIKDRMYYFDIKRSKEDLLLFLRDEDPWANYETSLRVKIPILPGKTYRSEPEGIIMCRGKNLVKFSINPFTIFLPNDNSSGNVEGIWE